MSGSRLVAVAVGWVAFAAAALSAWTPHVRCGLRRFRWVTRVLCSAIERRHLCARNAPKKKEISPGEAQRWLQCARPRGPCHSATLVRTDIARANFTNLTRAQAQAFTLACRSVRYSDKSKAGSSSLRARIVRPLQFFLRSPRTQSAVSVRKSSTAGHRPFIFSTPL